MIMALLREATRDDHVAMESDRLSRDLNGDHVDAWQYALALRAYYGFYAPLETALAALPYWQEQDFALAPRLKTGWLASDLEWFGLDPATIVVLPRCQDLPPLEDLSAAFGCLYVVEGATLGARFTGRHLCERLGLSREQGCRFFLGYDEETGPYWQEFRAFGEQISAQIDHERAVESARLTFRAMRAWFAACLAAAESPSAQTAFGLSSQKS